jgi:hypothetical protein
MGHEIQRPAFAELRLSAYIFYPDDSIFWIREKIKAKTPDTNE